METINSLSVDNVKRVSKSQLKKRKQVSWHSYQITVKQFLSVEEMMNVVHNILDECVSSDGELVLEMVDFTIKTNIISAYCYIQLPDDIDELYQVIYGTDLYKTVYMFANKDQIDTIHKSVWLYIQG